MRRYGLYDATRGRHAWRSPQASPACCSMWPPGWASSPTGRFWAELALVAAAGLVLALAPVLGGWTSGLDLRLSRGTFVLGLLPTFVIVGWILLATQPGNGWHEGTIVSWSTDLGLMGIVHSLGLWHGVLAFGLGLVLGSCLDAVPACGARLRSTAADREAADEPLVAEQREAARNAEPHMVVVGPAESD